MTVFEDTYTTEQTDLPIITPDAGKKIVIYMAYLKGVSGNIQFNGKTILELEAEGEKSIQGWIEGEVDKSVILNCEPNLTVKISYDEV